MTTLPTWIGPHGAAAAAVAALALFSAAVLAVWPVTIGLFAAGLIAAMLGIRPTRASGESRAVAVLIGSGGICGLGLFLTLFAPGLLNPLWTMDVSVPKSDSDKQVRVRRDDPRGQGLPLAGDDWTDAATEAIRQGDVVVRVDTVEAGRGPDKSDESHLKIHLRLANVGYERYIPFEGFTRDGHTPALGDDSGRSYSFVEERWRKRARGAKGRPPSKAEFEAAPAQVFYVVPNRNVERLLIFAGPPAESLKLELPAAAWGRQGILKFRVRVSDVRSP